MDYEFYGSTHLGLKRAINEDSYIIDKDLNLVIVADGMGGHNAGEVASKTAVESMANFLKRCNEDREFTWPFGINANMTEIENKVLTGIRLANKDLCNLSIEKRELSGMGTTIVAGMIDNDKMTIANVGDSRIYRIRKGAIEQLTTDHSWVSEQIQKKLISEEEARNHRWKNVITRALGNKTDVEVDIKTVEIKTSDIYIFCTDGLSGMITDQEIYDTIMASKSNLQEATQELINKANTAGGMDNITVVLLSFFRNLNEIDADTQA